MDDQTRQDNEDEPRVHEISATASIETRARGTLAVRYPLGRLREEVARADAHLTEPVDAYLIGGGAMSYAGLKGATKDIDLVLRTDADLDVLAQALEALDYKIVTEVDPAYRDLGASRYYDKDGAPRWDLYVGQVCRKLSLSPGMVERATREEPQLEKLRLHRLAPSDIFIFKSITEREADRDDMDAIYARGLPWDIVLSEMEWQSAHSEVAWSAAFHGALETIAERGDPVPILDELEALADREVGELAVLSHVGKGAVTRTAVVEAIGEEAEWVEGLIDGLLASNRLGEQDGRLALL